MLLATEIPPAKPRKITYPESDGKPLGETDIHIREILSLVALLDEHYRGRDDVYVAGNNMFYFEEGVPGKRCSPDVYVVFGIEKRNRRTYLLWEEKRPPNVMFEVSSHKTWRKDLSEKRALYASLGVSEYFLYDPENFYLRPPLQGFRLSEGHYRPIPAESDGSILSLELGMRLRLVDDRLRLFDAASGLPILRVEEGKRQVEDELEFAKQELERAKVMRLQAEDRRREIEASARKDAAEKDAEIARLRTELERFKNRP